MSVGRKYVVNKQTRTVHYIRFGDLLTSPALWSSHCGWAFGTADHQRMQTPPSAWKVCKKCMRQAGGHSGPGGHGASSSSSGPRPDAASPDGPASDGSDSSSSD